MGLIIREGVFNTAYLNYSRGLYTYENSTTHLL